MKRLSIGLVLLLAFVAPARAQLQGGSISGTVSDEQGAILPGATVTLRGVDATQEATTESSGQFRFLNLAPGFYTVSAALQGFTTLVREQVQVVVGRNVDLPLALRLASVAETITVTGESPLVDTRATGTATNFTSDELTKIPTSRDPFALMRAVPGVLVDRVNIGGNETGQQSNFVSKGTRPQDAVWTLDGVNITDMAATGASPTYFNYDNFEEVQVATAGQSIKQPTGGVGLNMIVKRGTNRFSGGVRGYFTNDSLESSNVPDELVAAGVTADTTDHNDQISDYGYDIGGPIFRNRAWFYHSYSIQDVRLVRRAGALVDRTILKNPNLKVNWQATSKDMVSFLYFDGFKIKDGRSPGISGILFDAPTATFHQDNEYDDNPLQGLWKIGNDRTIGSQTFLSAKFAYYNTGFVLDPMGGMDMLAGRSLLEARSYGSVNRSLNVRPQKTANVDLSQFLNAFGGSIDLTAGTGFRTVDTINGTLWPGNGILALENSATDRRAQVFREGYGGNRSSYFDVYAGATFSRGRMTTDLGVRYDRQWGRALPSQTRANPAFPDLVPGIDFAGYDSPFTWNNVSPRAGVTYAIDDTRRTVARVSVSRFAGQLNAGFIGARNPSSVAGSATYRWLDHNGDHLAQANEVQTDQFITAAGGFNPANPTAVTSANVIDPDLGAPVTTSLVAGVDRELVSNLAVTFNYSYTRTSGFPGVTTPRVGVTLDDYTPGPTLTGTLPTGEAYSVDTFIPDPVKVAAGGNGFVLDNWDGFKTAYHGMEAGLIKRLSNRWMARVGFALNNSRAHYDPQALRNENGNPTPTIGVPLDNGGQFAPQSAGSGAGTIFMSAKWQLNANALYVAAYGIELSANVFGRQGYPFLIYRPQSLGADAAVQVRLTPEVDTIRFPNLWNTDVRVARSFNAGNVRLRVVGDLFNLFNANTALVRNNNIASPTFNSLAQNLSPRILRFGLIVGF
jgi:Carboxypeptidase regulatory-like domain/TonB-dependent Receptor Plug Domain